jgi:hypothetical protein
MKKIASKKAYNARIKREVEKYGSFRGSFHPDTAGDDSGPPQLKTVIRRILEEGQKGGDPMLATILRKQAQKALAGDLRAAEFLINRGYGMPTQTVENTNPAITSIAIQIIDPRASTNGHSNGKEKH